MAGARRRQVLSHSMRGHDALKVGSQATAPGDVHAAYMHYSFRSAMESN